jgi:hypothetical protein
MATDAEIRAAGFKYIPQQQYLQNPFNLPVAPEAPVVNQGIVNTNAFNNSGGFSVYNADPNTISNMNPNTYALQDARRANELSYVGRNNPNETGLGDPNIIRMANFNEVFGDKKFTNEIGNFKGDTNLTVEGPERFNFPSSTSRPFYLTETEAMKEMERYPGYYGLDKPPPSKISELISKGINFIPGIGGMIRIGRAAADMLPINRRAIMENQLGTQGVMVDNIGRIVVGPGGNYNTPEGIMAGYNVPKMTDETFTGRQEDIRETLKDKYNMTDEQVDQVISGELTEDDKIFDDPKFKLPSGDTTNLITNLRNIEIARKNFADSSNLTDQIVDIRKDTRGNKGGGDGIDISAAGKIRSADNNFKGESGPTTKQESDYGYGPDEAYFARGGLASIL